MYNPSDVGKKGNIFGLPYSQEESELLIIPVELDVTVSYIEGVSNAPDLILGESSQLDLSLPLIKSPWEMPMAMTEPLEIMNINQKFRLKAKEIIDHLEKGGKESSIKNLQKEVNDYCILVHEVIESKCDEVMGKEKAVAILGGDHSSSLGLIRSLAKVHEFGILQIDAHMDLRQAYEGFEFSHASIMNNALKNERVTSLTQVGIRDYCEEEELYIEKSEKPLHVFFDELLYSERLGKKRWKDQATEIVDTLPDQVYISFDIDGLEPSLCPNTGTPVPGGLRFNEAVFLIDQIVRSGRKIIGFDLCEVGNSSWDANVGARVLFRLATAMGVSQGFLRYKD